MAATEAALSPKALADNPSAVHRLCDDRRLELAQAEPNGAHLMISRLAKRYGDRFTHITQNVDDLVERAGFAGSVHVHGNLTCLRSLGDPDLKVDIGYTRYWDGDVTHAPPQGFQFDDGNGNLFRPDIVLYGEQTKLYHRMFLVMGALHPDDLLVVMGTSGTVVPVNRWTANADCRKVLNNLHASNWVDESRFDSVIRERAAEAADEIERLVVSHLG